jgi:hypothetical protein
MHATKNNVKILECLPSLMLRTTYPVCPNYIPSACRVLCSESSFERCYCGLLQCTGAAELIWVPPPGSRSLQPAFTCGVRPAWPKGRIQQHQLRCFCMGYQRRKQKSGRKLIRKRPTYSTNYVSFYNEFSPNSPFLKSRFLSESLAQPHFQLLLVKRPCPFRIIVQTIFQTRQTLDQ